jgi:hypothetical protein
MSMTYIRGGGVDRGIVEVAGVVGAGVDDPLILDVEDVAALRGAVAVPQRALDLHPPNKNSRSGSGSVSLLMCNAYHTLPSHCQAQEPVSFV